MLLKQKWASFVFYTRSTWVFYFLPTPNSRIDLSGVVWGAGDDEQLRTCNVLLQSKARGEVAVTLTHTTIIPPYSEIIVEGRVAWSAES